MMTDGVIIDMIEQFVYTKTFFTRFPFKATFFASKHALQVCIQDQNVVTNKVQQQLNIYCKK